jgi:hypothetical protein
MVSGFVRESQRMLRFEARTHVAAEPERVWDTLLHTDRWSAWDRALDRIEGTLGPGGRITVRVKDQFRPFKPEVTAWEPTRRLVLRGGMPLGLFTDTRTYDLSANDTGTNVAMAETYTGPMASIIGKRLPDLQPNFEAFVAGWRHAAER